MLHHISYYSNTVFLCRSKAVFKALGEEDIGIYSCLVTHTDGASSSYTLSEEGVLQRTNKIYVSRSKSIKTT